MTGTIINEISERIESMKKRNKSEEHMINHVSGIIVGLKLAGMLSEKEAKSLKNEMIDLIYE